MVVHSDEIEPRIIDGTQLRGTRWRLGAAAGAVRAGLSRYRIAPGERAMPVHVHADEEELFYVLEGEGLSWQDGRAYPVRAGDCILHLPSADPHTILGAGDGLDVLAFSNGSDTGLTWLPRARAWWNGPHWLPHDGPNPFEAEEAAGPLEVPEPATERPPTIAALDAVPAEDFTGGGDVVVVRRDFGDALGSRGTGVGHLTVAAGALSSPPHCHAAEEEIFFVLGGEGTLLLGDEEHAVRAGSVVARPPATRVPHAFRAGDAALTLLAFGTREPNDIVFFPRSGKVGLRGLGVRFNITQVEYWDGEA
ncbi:MAG TPA: cupin domain-containing protein [Solirubrobacteraceae bacterium]